MIESGVSYVAECSGKLCKKHFGFKLNGRLLLIIGDVAVVHMLYTEQIGYS